jgi:hypothetical protein
MLAASLMFLMLTPSDPVNRPEPVMPSGITVRAVAGAEILRVGRDEPDAGPQDIPGQRRRLSDGRLVVEYR